VAEVQRNEKTEKKRIDKRERERERIKKGNKELERRKRYRCYYLSPID
jgi:hypothetical protein